MKNTHSFCYFTKKFDFESEDDYKSKYIAKEEELTKQKQKLYQYFEESMQSVNKMQKNNEEEYDFLNDDKKEKDKDEIPNVFIPQSPADFASQKIQYPKYSLKILPYVSPVKVKSPSQRFKERWSFIDHETHELKGNNYINTDSDADIFDFSDDISSNSNLTPVKKKNNDFDNINHRQKDSYIKQNEINSSFVNGSPSSTTSKYFQQTQNQNRNEQTISQTYSNNYDQETSSNIIQTQKYMIQNQQNESGKDSQTKSSYSKLNNLRKEFEKDFPPSGSTFEHSQNMANSNYSGNQPFPIEEEEEEINDEISSPISSNKNAKKEGKTTPKKQVSDGNNFEDDKISNKNQSLFDNLNETENKQQPKKQLPNINNSNEEEDEISPNLNQFEYDQTNMNESKEEETLNEIDLINDSINEESENENKTDNLDNSNQGETRKEEEEEIDDEIQFKSSNSKAIYFEEEEEEKEIKLESKTENQTDPSNLIEEEDKSEFDINISDMNSVHVNDEYDDTNQNEEESQYEMKIGDQNKKQQQEEEEKKSQMNDEEEEEKKSQMNDNEEEEEKKSQMNDDDEEELELEIAAKNSKEKDDDDEEEDNEAQITNILGEKEEEEDDEGNEEVEFEGKKDDDSEKGEVPSRKSKESSSFTTPKFQKSGESFFESSELDSNLTQLPDSDN